MAFPADPLPLKSEIFVDGAWVDLTELGRIRYDADVVITRGRANEQASLSPSTCAFTINNRDGLFSNRNPGSQYFGKLRKNIPFRQSIVEDTTYARFPNWLHDMETSVGTGLHVEDAGVIYTADKAVLDITGDLDVRVEVEPDDWITGDTLGMVFAAKYDNIDVSQRAWTFYLFTDGRLGFIWSSSGSAITGTALSTVPIDTSIRRQAFRATIDVNNGAGGATVTFYSSDSIGGSWTQLGDALVFGFTTSIFNSNSPLTLGKFSVASRNAFTNVYPFSGRFWGFELYSGIGGTLVAEMDPTAQSPGDTSWSDGLSTPNTWTVAAPAELTDVDYRFTGEVSELPQRWDSTGTDVYVPVVASGLTRRLTQGQSALASPLYRHLIHEPNTGYWPIEDAGQATSLANATQGGPAGTLVDVTLGPDDELPASAGVARINSSSSRMRGISTNTAAGTYCWLLWHWKLDAVPSGNVDIIDFYTGGHSRRVHLFTDGASFTFASYDSEDTLIDSSTFLIGTGVAVDEWIQMQFQIEDTGSGYDVNLRWHPVGDPTFINFGGSFSVGSGSVGAPREWRIGGDADLADAQFAHIMMGTSDFSLFDVNVPLMRAANAFIGELAAYRINRILREEGLRGCIIGDPRVSEAMGRQPTDTLLNIVAECVATDGGILYEPRDQLAYFYRTRRALYSQQGPQIDYSAGALSGSLEPTDDDQLTRNDVTVSRPLGSSARSVRESGPNNVNDPTTDPDGVGRYDSSLTKNPEDDARLPYLAQHETYLGTWDEIRYATVQVELARANYHGSTANLAKAAALAGLDIGDRFDLTGLPAWLPPDDVALLVQGYTETLRNRGWEIRWNTSPYGPYQYANTLIANDVVNPKRRAAAVASYLDADATSTADLLLVRTDRGPAWGASGDKPDNFPLDILVAGEVITVGNISPVGSVSVLDGSFEDGVADWTASGGTASQSTAQHRGGSNSCLITVSGSPTQVTLRIASSSNYAPVTTGEEYTFTFWIYSSITLTSTLSGVISWWDSGKNFLSSSGIPTTSAAANTWTKVTFTATAPASAAFASYGPTITGSPANGTLLYFDDLDLADAAGGAQQFRQLVRSVNGTVKALDEDDFVQVVNRFYAAL